MMVYLFEDDNTKTKTVIRSDHRLRIEAEISRAAEAYCTEEEYIYWTDNFDSIEEMRRAFYNDYMKAIDRGEKVIQIWDDLTITTLPLE